MGVVAPVCAEDRAATVAALRRKIAAVPAAPQRPLRSSVEPVPHVPAQSGPGASADGEVAATRERPRPAAAEPTGVPLPQSLQALVPGGGLAAGQTVACGGGHGLLVALLAAATAAGRRCAVVGYPHLGLAAVAAEGGDLSRLACVPGAGADPGAVVSVLLDGMDLVLLDPACGKITPARCRVLSGRARSGGAVLVVGTADWPNADLRLDPAAARVAGLDRGYGRITVLTVPVRARGKAVGAPAAPVAELRRLGTRSRSVADLHVLPVGQTSAAEPGLRADVPWLGARRAG